MEETMLTKSISYIITFISGSGLTLLFQWYNNRLQKMECLHIDDEVLSKLPIKINDGDEHSNIYCKTYRLKNTTNKDVERFKVFFQFDSASIIIDSHNKTKVGLNLHKMKKGRQNNECSVVIENFNRGDYVDFVFRVADVSNNEYYIRECECTGFKIITKDKRKAKEKTKSQRSDILLTSVAPVSALED